MSAAQPRTDCVSVCVCVCVSRARAIVQPSPTGDVGHAPARCASRVLRHQRRRRARPAIGGSTPELVAIGIGHDRRGIDDRPGRGEEAAASPARRKTRRSTLARPIPSSGGAGDSTMRSPRCRRDNGSVEQADRGPSHRAGEAAAFDLGQGRRLLAPPLAIDRGRPGIRSPSAASQASRRRSWLVRRRSHGRMARSRCAGDHPGGAGNAPSTASREPAGREDHG